MKFTSSSQSVSAAINAVTKLTPRKMKKDHVIISAGDGGIFAYRNNSESYAVSKIEGEAIESGAFAIANPSAIAHLNYNGEFAVIDNYFIGGGVNLALSDADVYNPYFEDTELKVLPSAAFGCTWLMENEIKKINSFIIFYENIVGMATSAFCSYYDLDYNFMNKGEYVAVDYVKPPGVSLAGVSKKRFWFKGNDVLFMTQTANVPNSLKPMIDFTKEKTIEVAVVMADDEFMARLKQANALSFDPAHRDGYASLAYSGSSLIIESKPTQSGYINETLSSPVDGKEFGLAFSPKRLLDAINSCNKNEDVYISVLKSRENDMFALKPTDGKLTSVMAQKANWK